MRFPIWRTSWGFRTRYRSLNQIPIYSISSSAARLHMDVNVVHDVANSEFYINLGKEKAILQYQCIDNVMDLYHTGVPTNQQGKGLAGYLVKAALSYVVEKDLKVVPTCSYVQHYINKNQSQELGERVIHGK